MAKDIDTDIDDDGFNDEGDLSFDDFNFDDEGFDPDGREVAKTPFQYGVHFAKATGEATASKLIEKIGQEMPNTSALVSDVMNIKNELSNLASESKEQVGTILRDSKKAIRPLLPYAEKLLPQNMYSKLNKALEVDEDYRNEEKSKETLRNEMITSEITSLFDQQNKAKVLELQEDRTNRIYDIVKDEKYHKESMVSGASLKHEMQLSNAFLNTSLLAYLKKSLELKYRHLFVAQDTLELSKATIKLLELQLPKIAHNTALPDYVKTTNSEMFKEQSKKKLIDYTQNKIKGWLTTGVNNFVKKANENLAATKSGVSDLESMMGMLGDESMQSMIDPKEEVMKGLGGLLGGWLMNPLQERIKAHLGARYQQIEESTKNWQEKLFGYFKGKQRNLENVELGEETFIQSQLKTLLDSFLPNIDVDPTISTSQATDVAKNPFAPTTLDVSMRQSIVEIIPGYLSKILQQISNIANGEDNDELIFDQTLNNFTTKDEIFKRLKKEAFDDPTKTARLSKAVGSLRGMYSLKDDSDESLSKFDNEYDNIRQFIFNKNRTKDAINIEDLLKYKQDNTFKSDFIKHNFKGIEDPNAVIDFILKIATNEDGTIDKFKLNQLSNNISEGGTGDEYYNKLSSITENTQYRRILDDYGIIDNRGKYNSKLNQNWIKENAQANLDNLDDVAKRAFVLEGQEETYRKEKEYEKAVKTSKINKFEHQVSDEDDKELIRIANLTKLGDEELDNYKKIIREREKKKQEDLENRSISKRFDNKNKFKIGSIGDLSKLDFSSIESLNTIGTTISTTIDKIYEFLTTEKKIDNNVNINVDNISDIFKDVDSKEIVSKFSFIEDVLLTGIDSNESGFKTVDTSINKILTWLETNKDSFNINSGKFIKEFKDTFSSIANSEIVNKAKDKATELFESGKEQYSKTKTYVEDENFLDNLKTDSNKLLEEAKKKSKDKITSLIDNTIGNENKQLIEDKIKELLPDSVKEFTDNIPDNIKDWSELTKEQINELKKKYPNLDLILKLRPKKKVAEPKFSGYNEDLDDILNFYDNDEDEEESKLSLKDRAKSIADSIFGKIRDSKLLQEETGSVDLTFLRNIKRNKLGSFYDNHILDKYLNKENLKNIKNLSKKSLKQLITNIKSTMLDENNPTSFEDINAWVEEYININSSALEDENTEDASKVSFKDRISSLGRRISKSYEDTNFSGMFDDLVSNAKGIKEKLEELVKPKTEPIDETTRAPLHQSSFDNSNATVNDILEEIRATTFAHMQRSAEDRTNMLAVLHEMNLFNYHQGDPKKEDGIVKRSAKFLVKAPFKLAGWGFKSSWATTKLAAKAGWKATTLTAAVPLAIHRKFKDVFGPQYLMDAAKFAVTAPLKAGWEMAKAPFTIAKGLYKAGLWAKDKAVGAYEGVKGWMGGKKGRTRHNPNKAKVPRYFDIYKAGTNNIVLFKEVQEGGVNLQDGTKLQRSVDITQPIVSMKDPSKVLVTQEDINYGLTDENGTPLSELAKQAETYQEKLKDKSSNEPTNEKKPGLAKKIGKGLLSAGKGSLQLLGGAARTGASVAGSLMTPMNRMMLETMKLGGKGIAATAKGLYNVFTGGVSSKVGDKIINRLDSIIELLGGEPPDDKEKEGLVSKGKKGIKYLFNKGLDLGKDLFDKVKNSKLVNDETGSVDVSFLNKLRRKKKDTIKEKDDKNTKPEKYDMLKNEELDNLKSFYGMDEDDTDEIEISLHSEGNSILEKILKSINKLVGIEEKESKIKDTDGDGKDDGKLFGWGKYNQRRKNKKEKKDATTTILNNKVGKGGLVGAGLSALGNKDKDDDDKGGILDTLIQTYLGGKILGMLTKVPFLGGLLTKLGLGSMIPGAAGAAGGAGVVAAGASAAAIAGTAAIGAGIGVATGYAINRITKHYSGSTRYGKNLLGLRKAKYGIKINGSVDAVKDFFAGGTRDWTTDLEKVCLNQAQKGLGIKLSEYEQIDFMVKLKYPLSDDAKSYFSVWFNERFVPVFTQYIEILKALKLDYYSVNNLRDDEKGAHEVTAAIKAIKVPNEKIFLDDYKLKKKLDQNKFWIDPVTGERVQGNKPTQEELDKRTKDIEDQRDKSVAGEEQKSWWKKSPVQWIKDKLKEKELDDIKYDPKYTFTGDQAKLFEKTKAWIKGHEGLSLKAYRDSRGLNTIGYGHLNVEGYTSISKQAADKLFDVDMDKHLAEAEKLPEYKDLDPVRKMALVNLVFNMGRAKFANFVKTRELLAAKKFPEAASELLRSDYAGQVGARANEVSAVLKTGDPKFIRPKSIAIKKEDRDLISDQDKELLSNKQFNDPNYMNTGTSPSDTSAKTSTNTPSTSTSGDPNNLAVKSDYTPSVTNEDGSKSPMVPTNKISSKISVPLPQAPEDVPPGKEGDAYKKEKPHVNIEGVNPQVKTNFEKMATVFKEGTKRPLTVTSGYRSIEQQSKLYNEMQAKAKAGKHITQVARPGSSLHNYGYALDISSRDANWLDTKGYLAKFGFHRPLLSKGEPWHIQPKGIDSKAVRAAGKAIQGEEGKDPKNINLANASSKDVKEAKKIEMTQQEVAKINQTSGGGMAGNIALMKAQKEKQDLVKETKKEVSKPSAPIISATAAPVVASITSTPEVQKTSEAHIPTPQVDASKPIESKVAVPKVIVPTTIAKEVTKPLPTVPTPSIPDIKVDVNNKEVVTETAKTNELLVQLIKLFVPVASYYKNPNNKETVTASNNKPDDSKAFKYNQNRTDEKVEAIIDTRRRS